MYVRRGFHTLIIRNALIPSVNRQSVSGEFELLQMVLESDTRQRAKKNVKPSRGVDCEIMEQSIRCGNIS